LLTDFKEKVRFLVSSFARSAHNIGCTPNVATIIGFVAAVVSGLCYGFRVNILLASVFCFFAGFFDVLDGTIASLFNEATTFGGFLDSLLDRYSDAAIISGIIFGGFCNPSWGILALVGTFLVSYARARGEGANVIMSSVGLAERAERIIIILVASLLTIIYVDALSLGIILLAIISHATVLQRVYHVWKRTKA